MSEQSAPDSSIKTGLENCSTIFTVTVFRNRKTKHVLFGEAGKDFIDTLFSFMLLPVGAVLHILSEGTRRAVHEVKRPLIGMAGIFSSVDAQILKVDKQDLLQPRPSNPGCTCGTSSTSNLTVLHDLELENILRGPMPKEALPEDYCRKDQFIKGNEHFKSGLMKENLRFIVTDNLKIVPSNATTTIHALKSLKVALVDDPEISEMVIGISQILQVLHSALVSRTCLNDVFGPGKK